MSIRTRHVPFGINLTIFTYLFHRGSVKSARETTRGESSVAVIKAYPGHLHTKIYCPTHVLNNVIIYQQRTVRAFGNEINLCRVRTRRFTIVTRKICTVINVVYMRLHAYFVSIYLILNIRYDVECHTCACLYV